MIANASNILDERGNPYQRMASQGDLEVAQRHSREWMTKYRELSARFDSAQTTSENMNHWANADNLSPAQAANPAVRQKLRSRARYELQENNSFGKGIVSTLANDTIGIGPKIQIRKHKSVERSINRWMKKARIGSKLRMMMENTPVAGEIFGLATTNSKIDHRVKLDLKLLEADFCTSPDLMQPDVNRIDGVHFDSEGNPSHYDFLKHHPGGMTGFGASLKPEKISADYVIHFFREDRPGQGRGLPWVTPALPLFAMLRRYTLAVIAAAETAAQFAGVMYTDSNAIDDIDEGSPFDEIELSMRSMLTLPAGWKLGQLKAEQPTTTYQMFRDAILNEIARCLNMPFNKAAGNSSGYNYASGRLDHQTYYEFIDVLRDEVEGIILERLFGWWLDEAALVGIVGQINLAEELDFSFLWPRREHIDPYKQAAANEKLWNIGLITDEQIIMENGHDPEEHYESLAREVEERKKLNLPLPGGSTLSEALTHDFTEETEDEPSKQEPAHA
ncbi:MAG: hypothetical protein COA78_24785 [Blastopirellula sp.]|nr:MAG: hypothetical protein COA78_24785 [Blastopirellula sp.]